MFYFLFLGSNEQTVFWHENPAKEIVFHQIYCVRNLLSYTLALLAIPGTGIGTSFASSGTFTVRVDRGPVFQELSFSSTTEASITKRYCPPLGKTNRN